MERAIKKATKVITLHSITAKPEFKNGPQTAKQKELYNRNEYNMYVPSNYLMMGKAYLHKHDYGLAIETFKFILSEYYYDDIIYETQVWLARTYNEAGEYKESEEILNALATSEEMSRKVSTDLYAAYADWYMKQQDYEGAIKSLTIAYNQVTKKTTKVRFAFILGQLHQAVGNAEEASYYFEKVIKMNPPYKMSFNARINRASVFVAGIGNSKEIKTELNKMLRDEKNFEYRDQIYYALGNMHYRENKIQEAIDYYKKSSGVSVSNTRQKTTTCLTLANIFYDRHEYQEAALYYDSAVVYLSSEHPDYQEIMAKATNLSTLVGNLQIVEFEDSVQRIASMSETERLGIIDGLITQVRKEEQLALQQESQTFQDAQYDRMMLAQSSRSGYSSAEGGKWYFYNPTAKSFGQPEFRVKWGNRKLEDNWRRKNKSAIAFGELESVSTDSSSQLVAEKKVLSNKTREYYLQNIPLNDSMLEISHNRIKEALFNAGVIYKNDLRDYKEATLRFEDLLNRYPANDFTLSTYYNLYDIYTKTDQIELSNYYKESIIREYPESQIAQILANPNYAEELMEKENEVSRFYEITYEKFKQELYNEVINNVDTAIVRYPDDDLTPKFMYLKVLSIGRTSDIMTFIEALDSLIKTFPGNDVTDNAQQILAFIKRSDPVVRLETEKKEAEEIYVYDTLSIYYYGMLIHNSIDVNQLKFEIINFNLDSFPQLTFDVINEPVEESNQLVLVKTFQNIDEAWDYYDRIALNEKVFDILRNTEFNKFIISETNAQTLIQDKVANKYMLFFSKYYVR